MESSSLLFFRILLNKIGMKIKGGLTPAHLHPLSTETASALLTLPIVSSDLLPLLRQKKKLLNEWHYSWIYTLIAPLKPQEQQAFLSLLNEDMFNKISTLLHLKQKKKDPHPLLKKFYRSKVLPLIATQTQVPIEYLSDTLFKNLLSLSKKELMQVIDLLGLYDLAHEIKLIVAKKTLTDLYACLSKKQQTFLKQCLQAKTGMTGSHLHLESWDGNKKTLMHLLHIRGIIRLSIALSGQDPNLVWHLSHVLDTGRGQLLQKKVRPEKIPGLTDPFAAQVETALNTLKRTTSHE